MRNRSPSSTPATHPPVAGGQSSAKDPEADNSNKDKDKSEAAAVTETKPVTKKDSIKRKESKSGTAAEAPELEAGAGGDAAKDAKDEKSHVIACSSSGEQTGSIEHKSCIEKCWREGVDYFKVETSIVCHEGESIQVRVTFNGSISTKSVIVFVCFTGITCDFTRGNIRVAMEVL